MASVIGVWVLDTVDDLRNAGLYDAICARWCASVARTRLKCYLKSGPSKCLSIMMLKDACNGLSFRMRLAGSRMPPATDQYVVLGNDRSHRWVGGAQAQSFMRLFNSEFHPLLICGLRGHGSIMA